jgi:hypothetical protein
MSWTRGVVRIFPPVVVLSSFATGMAVVMLICGAASAQDFTLEPARQYGSFVIQVGTNASTLVRHMTSFGGVLVMGSRYAVGAGFDRESQTERLYFRDLRTDASGMVQGVVLEGAVE